MKYMMFIKHTEDYADKTPPAGLFEAMGQFVDAAMKKGQMLDGAGLKPTMHGTKVRLANGTISIVDGPFTESKEIIGGYALMDLPSEEDALALARQFMELHQTHWPEFQGECEMRPLEDE